MGKARSLLEKLGNVKEEGTEDKDKDLVPINEPVEEPEKDDDFSDLNPDDGDGKKDEPDEETKVALKFFKHADDPDEDFDQEQLSAGIKVEMEHTDNKWIAAAIAKAHLKEFPNYYISLAKMEDELKKEKEAPAEKPAEEPKEEPEKPEKPAEDENDV
jgi:hypothetical protein